MITSRIARPCAGEVLYSGISVHQYGYSRWLEQSACPWSPTDPTFVHIEQHSSAIDPWLILHAHALMPNIIRLTPHFLSLASPKHMFTLRNNARQAQVLNATHVLQATSTSSTSDTNIHLPTQTKSNVRELSAGLGQVTLTSRSMSMQS